MRGLSKNGHLKWQLYVSSECCVNWYIKQDWAGKAGFWDNDKIRQDGDYIDKWWICKAGRGGGPNGKSQLWQIRVGENGADENGYVMYSSNHYVNGYYMKGCPQRDDAAGTLQKRKETSLYVFKPVRDSGEKKAKKKLLKGAAHGGNKEAGEQKSRLSAIVDAHLDGWGLYRAPRGKDCDRWQPGGASRDRRAIQRFVFAVALASAAFQGVRNGSI